MPKQMLAPLRVLGAPPARRIAAVVVAVLVGGWLGLVLAGNVNATVGPVEAQLSVRPWPVGDTQVRMPPLGSVTFDTHDGPLRLQASVESIRPKAATRIVENPESLGGLADRVVADLRAGMIRLVIKSTVAAMLGAGLFALVVYRRRWRWIIASMLSCTVFMMGSMLAGYATFNPQSIKEPRYTGLLTSAPRVVGNVADLAENFSQYRQELAKLISNVSQLYSTTSNLSMYQPDPSTIRVLHISDLHLNPAAWNIIHSVAEQFKVNVIIDSGDIVDHGTRAENTYLDEISTFDVPYVYIRGNHDSRATLRAVEREQGSVVLTGTVEEVAGLRIFGAGDPRFTPDKRTRNNPDLPTLRAVGLQLAERLRTLEPPADIAVIHDPEEARALDGTVPLLLSGHMHDRSTRIMPSGTRLMVQGSTGGAGLRALDGRQPTPIQLSVLYLDRKTGQLQAWDAISVGGLGLSSAQITRHIAPAPDRTIEPPESQSPQPESH